AVDLTERKVFEARLAHQAFHDALTGLPNRALFADRLDHALSVAAHRGDPVGVLMLDLDRFKVINDGLGHAAGDRLLIAVGERVGSCLRRTDTLARLGGDEFAVLLEGVTLAEARGTAERILAALQEPLDLDGREVYSATSIGVAVSSRDRHQAEELLRAADMALYRAKRAGRGMLVVFDPSERDASEDWLVLESDLRRALGGGELVLFYQPVLDLDTYQVVTVEALARWKHPTRGLLPPSEFIPLAEETGLITIITRWAVAESCRQLAEWKRELGMRAPDHVNVNLTTRDLRDPDFVDRVMGALEDAGLPSSALRLEITEQVLVEEIRAAAKTLGTLRAKGVRLAIDDFGAGASSLASLRSVDAEVLKLDRSFVRGITEGGDDQVLVGAITAMAHALGLQVTAEGIETGEQLAAVQAAGCDRGQGYFFARPMPAGAMSVWLAGEGVKNDRVRDTSLLVSTSP
ncbi:MAG: EAL domain-containing protein, partial [Thermomicrobiales bacterium]|nr:EAL domain-containing protein [Thermomicrobiales bacterium]